MGRKWICINQSSINDFEKSISYNVMKVRVEWTEKERHTRKVEHNFASDKSALEAKEHKSSLILDHHEP